MTVAEFARHLRALGLDHVHVRRSRDMWIVSASYLDGRELEARSETTLDHAAELLLAQAAAERYRQHDAD